MNDRDLDAEFERIIAGWDTDGVEPPQSAPSPDAATTPEPAQSADPGDAPTGAPAAGPTSIDLPIAPTTSHVWRGAEGPADDVDDLLEEAHPSSDSDHFVPPTETNLPTAEDDPMFWAIVGGLAGGPLLLLYVVFFDRDGSGWWVVTAISMIVVGFVLLVLRGGTERDPFDDGTRV